MVLGRVGRPGRVHVADSDNAADPWVYLDRAMVGGEAVRFVPGGGGSPERWLGPSKKPSEMPKYGQGFQRREIRLVDGRRIRRPASELLAGERGERSDSDVLKESRGKPSGETGEAVGESGWAEIKIQVRDEATGAVAEYTANQLDEKILNTLWDLWKTSEKNGFLSTGQVIEALDRNVHIVGLGDPSKTLLSSAHVSGANFWSSVIQEAPIDIIDKPLGSMKRGVYIGGVMIGVATGHMTMAYACFKALLHDEVRRMSAAAIKQLLAGDHSAGSHGNESLPTGNQAAHSVDSATHPYKQSIAAPRAERERTEQERREQETREFLDRMRRLRAARAGQERTEQERREQETREFLDRMRRLRAARAGQERTEQERREQETREFLDRMRRLRAARAGQEGAARAEEQAIAKPLREGNSTAADTAVIGKNVEAREIFSLAGLSSSSGRPGAGALQNRGKSTLDASAGNRRLKFARLRIYYVSHSPTIPNNDLGQSAGPTTLVVMRESGWLFLQPELLKVTDIASASSVASGAGDYFFATHKECQLWNAIDGIGFARNSPSMAAFQLNLRRAFLGLPLDLRGGGLKVKRIATGSFNQHAVPTMSCIEVIGIIDGNVSEEPKIAGLGFKAPTCDEFGRAVISAVDKLADTDRS